MALQPSALEQNTPGQLAAVVRGQEARRRGTTPVPLPASVGVAGSVVALPRFPLRAEREAAAASAGVDIVSYNLLMDMQHRDITPDDYEMLRRCVGPYCSRLGTLHLTGGGSHLAPTTRPGAEHGTGVVPHTPGPPPCTTPIPTRVPAAATFASSPGDHRRSQPATLCATACNPRRRIPQPCAPQPRHERQAKNALADHPGDPRAVLGDPGHLPPGHLHDRDGWGCLLVGRRAALQHLHGESCRGRACAQTPLHSGTVEVPWPWPAAAHAATHCSRGPSACSGPASAPD